MWYILWFLVVHSTPATHPTISKKERQYIENHTVPRKVFDHPFLKTTLIFRSEMDLLSIFRNPGLKLFVRLFTISNIKLGIFKLFQAVFFATFILRGNIRYCKVFQESLLITFIKHDVEKSCQ